MTINNVVVIEAGYFKIALNTSMQHC